jgi:hypothetical protein
MPSVGKCARIVSGNVAEREMGIVLFRHACVGVAKLLCNDAHRDATYAKRRLPLAAPVIYSGVLFS